jgi:hypothetical protein
VQIRNPFSDPQEALIQMIAPDGWSIERDTQRIELSSVHWLLFNITVPHAAVRRARLTLDLTIGERRFGQQSQALVTVLPRTPLAMPDQVSDWTSDTNTNWQSNSSDLGSNTMSPLPVS